VFRGALRLTTIGLLVAVTLVAFEAMAVPTAMPTAVRELPGLAHYGWAFSGFIIASVIGMVASAWHAHITLSMLALARLAGAKALAEKGNRHPRTGMINYTFPELRRLLVH
jgi:hypothetical protein